MTGGGAIPADIEGASSATARPTVDASSRRTRVHRRRDAVAHHQRLGHRPERVGRLGRHLRHRNQDSGDVDLVDITTVAPRGCRTHRQRRPRRVPSREACSARGPGPGAGGRDDEAGDRAGDPEVGGEVLRRRDELVSRFQFVADHRDTFEVERLCQTVEVSRSSFYAWEKAAPGQVERAARDAALAARIKVVQAQDRADGAPRVTAELNDGAAPEERVNHKRVTLFVREHHLPGLRLRRRVRTTVPEPSHRRRCRTCSSGTPPPPHQLQVRRGPHLPAAGVRRNLYLATVIDCYSRRLAGWAIADHMRTAPHRHRPAQRRRDPRKPGRRDLPRDHGAQSTSRAYAELCSRLGVTQSMGAVGSSADKAPGRVVQRHPQARAPARCRRLAR